MGEKRLRRMLGAAALVLAGLGAGAALASGSPGHGMRKARFPSYGVSLRYARSWTRVNCSETMNEVMPIALLRTARHGPGCSQPNKTGVAITWPPVERLGANGVSVALAIAAVFPGTKQRWNARIGHRRAQVIVSYSRAGVTCPAGVRAESRRVSIKRPHAVNEMFVVAADLCGPNLAAGEAAVHRLLTSVRFAR